MSVKLTRSGVLVALGLAASTAYAGDIPANLGYGAEKLVESQVLLRGGAARGPLFNGFATEAAADYAARAIVEPESGRYLVDILPRRVGIDALQNLIAAKIPSFRTAAVDRNYRSTGIIEGYVDVNDLAKLANVPGVRSVFLALKPDTNSSFNVGAKSAPEPNIAPGTQLKKLGTAFDQGVIQHRVDRINQFYNPSAPVNYDGAGISVGVMSDSYDTRAAAPHAATGVANFDLPGAAGHPLNTQPVVVLIDDPAPGTDEGRGMAEIVHKMAPRARLAFATGVLGEVQFGNDIRALAALPGFEYAPGTQQGFKADVITDDLSYGGEPFFGESIIGNAIDDVTAAGVSYFSSAGNNIGINAYESVLRWVPNGTGNTSATNAALVGTNIDLTGVPANLYAGGFHNFNPAAGQQDVAQLVNTPSTSGATGSTEMQWDDPYDQRDLVLVQPPIFTGTGTTNGTFNGASVPALPQFTAGTPVVITETATSGDFDGIVTVIDPNGATLINQDTGTDEIVTFFVPISGQYQIVVAPFSTTTGNFTVTVNTAQGSGSVTSDLNLLVFRADTGAYVASRSLTTNNIANNRPVELGTIFVAGQTQTQFVIARTTTPVAPQLPTRVRWSTRGNGLGNIGPAEYFTYNATTTKGHATAKGCNGTAAYSVFRPSLAESFTSPGPAVIYFDKDSNRLPTPEYRQVPRVAAADAANTSFFGADSGSDLDTTAGNFSGTSAAAPHAAAIAALVLQAHGGPGSLSPQDMRTILQTNVFPHDLDPSSASGTAVTSDGGGVIITIDADNDANVATGDQDPASIKVSYVGPGSLASLTFNPFGSAFNGGNVTGGNNGYVDDVGSNPATLTYFDNNYPGLLFLPATKAFTLGTLTGLVPGDIAAPQSTAPFNGFTNLGPVPANGTTQFWTMNVGFPTGQFTDGKVMRFTVGRGAAHSSSVVGTVPGNGPSGGTITRNPIADLFGGGVMLPSGTVIADGMLFTGTTTSGGTFSGRIRNNIGTGYSVVDAYGFIDAAAATGAIGGMLAASATSSPAFAGVSGQVLFTVNVTPGASPASTGIAVFGNLNGIGGGGFQQFFDNGTNGDVTAGDNVYSFLGTVAQGTTPGAKQIVATVTDQQSRTGTAAVNFAVLSPASPSGLGSASPNSGSAGSITLLTVQVTPGASPASTGITVRANLSSIGGSATQQLFDNGTNGDVTAGDGNYSFSATVAPATTAGAKLFAVTITDAQLRTGNASIAYSVLAPTAISGFGSATPGSAAIGQSSVLTVSVTPGANPTSSGVTVTADLSSIGGSATQALYDDGTNGDVTAGDLLFSFGATVGVGTAPGTKNLAVSIGDAQARTANASIVLNVPGPNAPTGVGLATPTMVILGAPTTLAVAVTPGNTPVSTGLAATVDLTAIGGSATQALYDDGTNGDQVAGDNIFTFSTTVPAETAAGVVLLPVTITDAQLRSGGATITVDVRTNLVFSDGYDDL